MANGTRVPTSEVKEGDYVYATDPETAESGPREVIATLPHTDQLLTLWLSSGDVVRTETTSTGTRRTRPGSRASISASPAATYRTRT